MQKCPDHPRYTGTNQPSGDNAECPHCWAIFQANYDQYLGITGLQQAEIDKWHKKYLALKRQFEQLEGRTDDNAIIALVSGELNNNYHTHKIKPTKRPGKNEATAFMICSDWHLEEEVRPETVAGFNTFNLQIAEQRVNNIFANAVRMIHTLEAEIPITTLVVALLGDFITGNIHEDTSYMCQLEPTNAIVFAQEQIASGLKYLEENLTNQKKIIVVCHSGNHGRITPKQMIASEQGMSLEYLMYNSLKEQFRHNKKFEFLVSKGYHSYLEVYDKTFRFHHGHLIRYWGGIGGITIPVNKAIAQWNKIKRVNFDIFGHFHQLLFGSDFICNGSLVGYNAYAMSIKAQFEEPKQGFFLLDKHRGITWFGPILTQ
jgi:hypothetical protein